MSAFGLLAALIPIVTSLGAAGSFLAEQANTRDEQRRRYRIAVLVEALRQKIDAEDRVAENGGWSPDAQARKDLQVARLSKRLHEANGIERANATYRDEAIRASMSKPVEPLSEVSRQWMVLMGAMLGVVFLALDAIV